MLVPIVLLTTALGQTAGPRPGIDVPAGDSRVWQLHQADLSRREAETQAAAATITSARVRARLQLNRVDEALDDLMRLVSERPLDAVDALRNLDAGTHFSDGARDYAPKLNAIFAAAHARAGELPKEDAAVVEFAAKALATLALDDLQQGRAAAARARFRQFLERYPRSEYAWLATLHAAEALANDGDWSAAEREFSEAAATYTGTTIAVVLGRVLAAHAAEAAGHPARGLDRYTAALAAWPRETFAVSLYTRREAPEFRRTDIARRAGLLRASLARPGGDLLERARWQLANGQRTAAIATLEDVLRRFAASPARPEATVLLHRAQLEAALDLANIERPDADAAAAAARIEALAKQPLDPATVAARIARASQMWSRGDAEAARSAMAAALGEWMQAQPHDAAQTGIEADVAAIRDAVFRPLGGGIYSGRRGWNAFQWPASPPRFLLVDPDVPVKLPSGDDTTIRVTQPLADHANVVFADDTMLGLLGRTLVALGGTKRRQPAQIMETPNQPVGESMNILALWNEFFPARPGHWGGFEFTSYPRLTRIRFLDAARTRAAADVTIGYSGATVVLEKRGTTWTPVKLTNEWIT